jgi:hypothetical protein
MKPRHTLHIEHLVLEGVASRDRAQLVAALRAELERLLARQPLANSARQSKLDAGTLPLSSHAPAQLLGVQAARQLYASLQAGAVAAPATMALRGASIKEGKS